MRTIVLSMLLTIGLSGCSSVSEIDTSPPKTELSFGRDIQLLAQLPDEVMETSGLALRGDLIWTINDSGDGPILYALNKQYKLERTVIVSGAKNVDWEELAQDEQYLYIADCGNNRGSRNTLQIYKVRWQDLERPAADVPAEKISFEYADRQGEIDPKNHNYDCEALTSVGDELWLFTKNRKDQKTNLYRLNKSGSFQSLIPSSNYDVGGLITAADYEPGSKHIALLGYEKNVIFGSSFIWVIPVKEQGGLTLDWALAQHKKLSPYAQWEALKWDVTSKGARVIFSSEKSPLLDVSMGYINVVLPSKEAFTEN